MLNDAFLCLLSNKIKRRKKDYWWPAKRTHQETTDGWLQSRSVPRTSFLFFLLKKNLFGRPVITRFRFSLLWQVVNLRCQKTSEPFFHHCRLFFLVLCFPVHAFGQGFIEPSTKFFFAPVKIKEILLHEHLAPFATFFLFFSFLLLQIFVASFSRCCKTGNWWDSSTVSGLGC